ncbi:hypothetical protein J7E73_07570 [Paenibacillus albidus]|uniref:hypothetical protein n=1 Tax=Paenibacillus albidus TaxID=2041023 RepID=UPI001BE6D1C9|nr:hypothetical protein [Paenibacillus albidus]MBT2288993.1 hypothetical protein [Paenibacillus albidus]
METEAMEGTEGIEKINHKQMLLSTIRALEPRYNPELRLLRSPFSSPGYHTTLRNVEFIHSTRDSLSYALGLLDTELPSYEQRAFEIIAQVVSLQEQDRSRDTFGIWSWFYEEPLDRMAPPDWNWADFCGSRLVLALSRHGHRIPEELREAVRQAVTYACEAIIKRNVGPDYTNIAILGALVTSLASEELGRADFAAYGLERLTRLYEYTKPRRVFQEYNSPVYTYIAILELSKFRAGTKEDRVKLLCDELIDMTWKTVAEHYHPATGQWSGPHSRCYETLLNEQSGAFLQVATGGKVKFFAWDDLPYEEEWYGSGISCPEAYLELFTFPATKEVRRLYEGGAYVSAGDGKESQGSEGGECVSEGDGTEGRGSEGGEYVSEGDGKESQGSEGGAYVSEGDGTKGQGSEGGASSGTGEKWAVTFLTPEYSLGSFSNSDCWNQRRPLLAYVNNEGRPASVRFRCLHDGYDYCSARFQSWQQRGHVLFGIDFLTDGGDTHPNLDRIDGCIEAEDFRLRLEIGGHLNGVQAIHREKGVLIQIGPVGCELRNWFAGFSGEGAEKRSLEWEVRELEDTLAADLVLYSGARRTIDFRKLEQAAIVCSLDMGSSEVAAAPVIEAAASGGLRIGPGPDVAAVGRSSGGETADEPIAGRETAFYLSLRPRPGV